MFIYLLTSFVSITLLWFPTCFAFEAYPLYLTLKLLYLTILLFVGEVIYIYQDLIPLLYLRRFLRLGITGTFLDLGKTSLEYKVYITLLATCNIVLIEPLLGMSSNPPFPIDYTKDNRGFVALDHSFPIL